MRQDSTSFIGGSNYLHFHDGCTCHGTNDLPKSIDHHKRFRENIDIYEHTDKYEDKTVVKCYVGIRPDYDQGHYKRFWKRKVKLVATIRVELIVKLL